VINLKMDENKPSLEIERILLEVYPEATRFIETIKQAGRLDEISILNMPYIELIRHGDQNPEEGPFWTVLRNDNEQYRFHVISISLQNNHSTIAIRRRDGTSGAGKVFRENEIEEYFLRDKFETLSKLYRGWFVEARKIGS